MISRKLRFWLQIFSAGFVVFLLAFPALAQDDADPNSPTPILMSETDSARALATEAVKTWRGELPTPQARAFGLNQRIVLFLTNVDLMEGEGANAFRVYVEDSQGKLYRFPVLELTRVKAEKTIYAVTVELRDELGFWGQPVEDGDVLVGITWRGLASNRLRLGLGKVGGEIKDDPTGDVPLPEKSAITKGFETANNPGYVGYRWSGDRIRFLEQATFGPTQALDDRIRRIGLKTWLAEQFEAPYPSASTPYPNIPLKNINVEDVTTGCGMFANPSPERTICIRDHYSMYPVQIWFYKNALYGEPQLRHRVNWALHQIWVISGLDTQQSSWMIEYQQRMNDNAFGNWRNLMKDMTLNPAMGNYLDMIRSTRTNPNENYAREVLQLFNIGLFMLNQDGTVQVDGQGNPIPSYDQNIVNNFTKVFTGWQNCEVTGPNCPDRVVGAPNYKDPMLLSNGTLHDITAKTLFSYPGSTTTNIAACTGCSNAQILTYGNASLDQALDNIYGHPNVAPFVSKKLIQSLVTSDPTPAYVGRVAAVFTANKSNPTQMKEVIKAILLDPEARGDFKTDQRYGKLREPVSFTTNLYRDFNVASFDGTQQSDGDIDRLSNGMGQRAFYSPTVFNYFPADYVVPGSTILAPEFGIFTTGTSIARANAVNSIVFNRIAVSLPNTPNGTSINLAEWSALAAADTSSNMLMDALNQKMMHGTMPAAMRSTIMTAVNTAPSSNPLLRAQSAIYLIATSSQYQVQR
jgi:uncharacterized protein (DUF1800 family)